MLVTKDFIKALRTATQAHVRIDTKEATTDGLCCRVTLVRKITSGSWNTEAEQVFRFGGGVNSGSQAFFARCFVSGAWQSLGLLLREGDELCFLASENSNGYLEAAEILPGKMGVNHPGGYPKLHHDELVCWVKRNKRTVVERLLLDWSVCPDNSARAIR